jgi:IclR family pca regulon transcriptional regulator
MERNFRLMTENDSSFIQSLAKGLSVICSFSGDRPAQTLTQVAKFTGMTRASARRILLTLEKLDYVSCDCNLFSLTPKVLDLGFSYLKSLPFWTLALPIMEDLTAHTGESCSVSVLNGWEVQYVLRVPAHRIMSINLSVGTRLPAYCTSMGRVLLAGLSDTDVDHVLRISPLTAYTKKTIVDTLELKKRIAECRSRGWTINYQELEEGLISMAAPIINRHGRWIAAMNISGHALTYSPEEFKNRFLEQLLKATRTVSNML